MGKGRVLAVLILAVLLLTAVMPHLAAGDAIDKPVNDSPLSGSTEIGPGHTFVVTWAADADGDVAYATQWQWRTATGSYALPLYDSGIIVSDSKEASYPPGVFDYGETYYWHMRVQNNHGQWSLWSDETSFTVVVNSPPSQPENFEPDDNAANVAMAPSLEASEFRDPNQAEVVLGESDSHAVSQWQVTATAGDYSSPVFDSGIAGTDLTSIGVPAGKLAASTKYYWHVRYQDSYGNWSAYSQETSFTTKSPSAPTADFSVEEELLFTDGTVGITFLDKSVSLAEITLWSWDFGDGSAAENWTMSTRPANGLIGHIYAKGGTYLVQLTVRNGLGESDTMAGSLSILAPVKPYNIAPVNGASGISPSQRLQASTFLDPEGDVHFASQWQMVMAGSDMAKNDDGSFKYPLYDSGIDTANKTTIPLPIGRLAYSTTYYWHVRYQDNLGSWSDWSDETSFTIVANSAPNQPVNYSPASGATSVTVIPVLKASDFSDPDSSAYVALTDTHSASQWVVRADGGTYSNPVYGASYTASTIGFVAATKKITDSANGLAIFKTGDTITITGSASNNGVFTVAQGNTAGELIVAQSLRDETAAYSVSMNNVTTTSLTSVAIPAGELQANTKYYWHVRYQDSYGNWSAFSTETSFTTKPMSTPIAVFTADTTEVVAEESTVTFADNSTPAGEITEWRWDFGDNTTDNWTVRDRPANGKVSHLYTVGGKSYTVKLTVVNTAGEDTAEMEIVVHARPKAVIAALTPKKAETGKEITLYENSDGEITQWVWDFGDGSDLVVWDKAARDAAEGKVNHTFRESGKKVVTLEVVGTIEGQEVKHRSNWEIQVSGPGGFHFALWMIGVVVLAIAVIAGIVYVLRARRAK